MVLRMLMFTPSLENLKKKYICWTAFLPKDWPAIAFSVALLGNILTPGLQILAALAAAYQKYKLCHGNRPLVKNGSPKIPSTCKGDTVILENNSLCLFPSISNNESRSKNGCHLAIVSCCLIKFLQMKSNEIIFYTEKFWCFRLKAAKLWPIQI